MTTERPIQPTDPEKEPKTHATGQKDQQQPREQPYQESYGKTGRDPRGEGRPSDTAKGRAKPA
ncbi:hypothetical protein SAMN07250955_104127 [Arboricoccus pini]|uniref:Uncharacterized protein n=1 Tax=Arboricoccus pini TaxID=1963835 RepID=A0A212QYC2_9PROT|nr:hypothetical protein [Arboricoccus pini]SNB64710.1 hypothetical protein SAMN07250955_104127 [Arboricoccus pini]